MRSVLPGEGTCVKIPFIFLCERLLRQLAFSPVGGGQAGKSEPDLNTHAKEKVVQAQLAQYQAGRIVLPEQGERQAQKSGAEKQEGAGFRGRCGGVECES